MNAEDWFLVKTLVSALSEHISLPSGSSNPLITSMFAVHGRFVCQLVFFFTRIEKKTLYILCFVQCLLENGLIFYCK